MPTRLPLTPDQRRAAATTVTNAFIVAGPGCGKTTVAAERYGVSRYVGDQPGLRTLGVSFARSATYELWQRVRDRWGSGAAEWPNNIQTLDALHCEVLRHLLVIGTLKWPGGHTELTVLDTWRGQTGSRYLLPDQGWRRAATVSGDGRVISVGRPITRAGYGIGTRAPFEAHLAAGICTHDEVRSVLRAVVSRDDLRPAVADYLRDTTSSLIVDEVFDADNLDVAVILLAGLSGIPTTLIGDPWQALYEFRGAPPELVPKLVETQGYETFPVTQSFRFVTSETQKLAADLRAGRPVDVQTASTGEVDVVLAPEWEMLWQADPRVLPLSFGRIDNQTDAAIVLLLDQLVGAHFARGAIFAQEAMTLLDLDPDVVRVQGAEKLRPVLDTLRTESPDAAARAIRQLRTALRDLGSPRQLRALAATGEAQQQARLEALALRLRSGAHVPGMTIHQAKGMEWTAVGVRLGPTHLERLRSGLDESKADDRAVYVALTRARERVRLV
jgi:DNA helicase II / ATP-dependent DNA helicase PcrA